MKLVIITVIQLQKRLKHMNEVFSDLNINVTQYKTFHSCFQSVVLDDQNYILEQSTDDKYKFKKYDVYGLYICDI